MNSLNTKEDDRIKQFNSYVPIIIAGSTFLLIVLPAFLYGIAYRFNEDSGKLADTIGGIATPIIGLLTSALLYFSLRAQIRANEKIQFQIDGLNHQVHFDYCRSELADLNNAIDNFDYQVANTDKTALESITKDINHYCSNASSAIVEKFHKMFDLEILIFEINSFTEQVLLNNFLSDTQRRIISDKLYKLYLTKLNEPLVTIAAWNFEKYVQNSFHRESIDRAKTIQSWAHRLTENFSKHKRQ